LLKSLRSLKLEHWIGLLFVLVLHGAVLYKLWSYRISPKPVDETTIMVNIINSTTTDQPKPPKHQPVEPPKQQLVAETPAVTPDEPVAYVPPTPEVEAPPLPTQPVVLAGELSVSCQERTPPDYPSLSKRMNEQGKVVLRVELGEDGRVAHLEVIKSSGSQRLDSAALSAVKAWRCRPTMRNGVAVKAVALQPFNFILEGR
jgi:protein TonB